MWVRRIEILTGCVAISLGVQSWSDGWVHWLLIGVGLMSLSPWPGVRQVLRRAERRPEVLRQNYEPEGARRARRVVILGAPVAAVIAAAIGYAYGRWLGAGIDFVLVGFSAGLGGWWSLRRFR